MKIYKPVFTTEWIIEEINADDLRRIGKDTILHKCGTIYNDNFYTTRAGAVMYINKEEYNAEMYRVHI